MSASNAAAIAISFGIGLHPRRNAFHVEADLVDAGARRAVERLVVAVAELDVGRQLGPLDGADMLALRPDDPHAAGPGLPHVALHVDAHPVADAAVPMAVP